MRAKLNYAEQNNLLDPSLARPVTLIGAGSVGSYLATLLVKEGCPDLRVYDFDNVESHNIAIADYGIADLAQLKVTALADTIRSRTGFDISAYPVPYNGQKLVGNVICCVDNMEARQVVWDKVYGPANSPDPDPNIGIFLDTRTDKQFIEIFAFNPCDKLRADEYKKYFYKSSEANRPTCGTHGLPDLAMMTAALAMRVLRNIWTGDRKSRHIRLFPDLKTVDDPVFDEPELIASGIAEMLLGD